MSIATRVIGRKGRHTRITLHFHLSFKLGGGYLRCSDGWFDSANSHTSRRGSAWAGYAGCTGRHRTVADNRRHSDCPSDGREAGGREDSTRTRSAGVACPNTAM